MSINRRRFERFELPPMYSSVRIRPLWSDRYTHEGHAYDVSEGGLRFETDDPLTPGTPVAIELLLPRAPGEDNDERGRAVYAFGNIIWVNDEDVPGPVRMAAVFTRFVRAGDRERLMSQLVANRYRRAA